MSKLNLINGILDPNKVAEKLSTSSEFSYDCIEGGFVSHDNSVIVVTDRKPYVGMVLQFCPNMSEERKSHWVNYLEDLFNIKEDKNNG